jgi:RHS repeat-associated protein
MGSKLIYCTGIVFVFVLLASSAFAMYCPETGRFLQRDPIGVDPSQNFQPQKQYSDGMCLYGYVQYNPCRYVDPHGTLASMPIVDWYYSTCGLVLYCRNNELGIPGLAGFDHCRVHSINDIAIRPGEDVKLIGVVVDRSPGRMIQYGKKAGVVGKSCACASCEDIRHCVNQATLIHGCYGPSNNCQTAAARELSGCCLKSTWNPSWPMGTSPFCAEWEYIERGMDGVVTRRCIRWVWQ